jgi:hypothetical protein
MTPSMRAMSQDAYGGSEVAMVIAADRPVPVCAKTLRTV